MNHVCLWIACTAGLIQQLLCAQEYNLSDGQPKKYNLAIPLVSEETA